MVIVFLRQIQTYIALFGSLLPTRQEHTNSTGFIMQVPSSSEFNLL
jgi:hypothetical protein